MLFIQQSVGSRQTLDLYLQLSSFHYIKETIFFLIGTNYMIYLPKSMAFSSLDR